MFKKEDIKVGMAVDIQGYMNPSSNGLHIVLINCSNEKILIHNNGWDKLSNFDHNLKSVGKVRIEKIYSSTYFTKDMFNMDLDGRELIWERKEQKENDNSRN